MADTDRIKRNLSKMLEAGAPEADMDSYLATEGFKSPDEWRAALKPAPVSDGMAKSFGQGATMGFGDELAASVRSAVPDFSNWMMRGPSLQRDASIGGPNPEPQTVSTAPTYDQRYDDELAKERQAMKEFTAQNPKLALGSEVAGNVVGGVAMSAIPGVGALFRGGGGLGGNIVKGAVGGGVLGGAQGFGQGEGGFDQRLRNAGMGAMVGASAGATLPILAKGAEIIYKKAAPALLNKIAGVADKYTTQVPLKSLSAAAPDGAVVPQDSLALKIADKTRGWAGNIEEDAAMSRLAKAVSGSGGVDKARGKLAALGDDAFIADANKGTERLANVGYLTSDDAADKYVSAYTTRDARTGKRFIAAMGEDANVPNISDAQRFLKEYKSAKGSQIYDPILRGDEKFNISPAMQDILERPGSSAREVLDRMMVEADKHGVDLPVAEALHRVKRTLNADAKQSVIGGGASIQKDFVAKAGNNFERELYAANPQIQAADETYAKIANLSNPEKGNGYLERGYKFLKQGISPEAVEASPAGLAVKLAEATPEQALTYRVGTSNNMIDAAKSGPEPTRRLAKAIATNEILQEKLAQNYGPAQAAELIKRSRAELDFSAAKNRVTAGSPTAERAVALAREAGLTPPPSGSVGMATLNWLGDAFKKMDAESGPVRSRLADLLANPDRKVNAETLSLVEELLKRQAMMPNLSTGVAGAAGAASSKMP